MAINELVKFIDGSAERGGLHTVFFRATVGASGALTPTRTSPSIVSVVRTGTGAYTITFDSTWVTLPKSLDVSPLYDINPQIIGNNAVLGTNANYIQVTKDNAANQDGSSGPIINFRCFSGTTVADIAQNDELMIAIELSTSLV